MSEPSHKLQAVRRYNQSGVTTMSRPRLALVNYDLLRELCDSCRAETFHFVPKGAPAAAARCRKCGDHGTLADVSDTSIIRLVTTSTGEVVIVPMISR